MCPENWGREVGEQNSNKIDNIEIIKLKKPWLSGLF